jgi:hypothetical protein
MRRIALALSLALVPALGAQGGTVSLLVIDDATDAPVPDVHVTIVGQTTEGVTDARGRFVYVVARPSKVVFVLRRLGYNPGTLSVDVAGSDTERVTFAMTAAPQTLATVDVKDTLNSASPFLSGFDRRLANHAGAASYITRNEIEKRKPSLTTDLLRRIGSLTIVDSSGTLMAVSRRVQKPNIRTGGVVMDLKNCPLQVAIDGQLREWGFAVNNIAPEEIHGIEIYPGPATIPAEFASMKRDANCGLIMIWTRRAK